MTDALTVAILGAGFSGIAVGYELVQQAQVPLQLIFFDPSPYAGTGIAYSTDCPGHLLNVPAEQMSALKRDPEHFYNWLHTEAHRWRSLDPSFHHLQIRKNMFLPRMIYGSYLKQLTAQMIEAANLKGSSVQWLSETVDCVSLRERGQLLLSTTSGNKYSAQAMVLAVGVPWTRVLPQKGELCADYLRAPWPYLTNMALARAWLKNCTPSSILAIVGSGLTMLDVLATLEAVGYPGKILVMSRSGFFPQPHDLASQPAHLHLSTRAFPRSAAGIFRELRKQCQLAEEQGEGWRSAIDAMRPITAALWRELSIENKRRMLRHAFGLWNSYRHRAPPEALVVMQRYQKEQRLTLIKAQVEALERTGSGLHINAIDTSSGQPIKLFADLVVNCTGPSFEVSKQPCQLIHNLLKEGLAEADSLGLGLKTSANGGLIGPAQHQLFTLGATLFGTYFETIAVPEIRTQCETVVATLLTGLR